MLNLVRSISIRAPNRERLRELIAQKSLKTGLSITLASGKSSNVYFDMKKVIMDPEGSNLVADEILDILKDYQVDCVGGLEMGAVPIVSAVCVKSYLRKPIPGFFVRKQPKGHGTQSLIDGFFNSGDRVVILDDVTTSGGSVMKAVKSVRDAGGRVEHVITVVDRLEGAAEFLESQSVKLIPLLTRDHFVTNGSTRV